MTLTLDFHDPIKLWNSRIWYMGGPIDIKRKGRESIIYDHDHELSVATTRCVNVPESDRGNPCSF